MKYDFSPSPSKMAYENIKYIAAITTLGQNELANLALGQAFFLNCNCYWKKIIEIIFVKSSG